MASITTTNPSTNEPLATYTLLTDSEVHMRIGQAQDRYLLYRTTSYAERSEKMRKAASILRERKAIYAETMTLEMGKTYKQGLAEVEKCAWVCEYYAGHAADFLADELVATEARKSAIVYQPLGVVLAVMPWNFPFWQVFRFAAPALMAGNVALLKHASNVPACALHIQDVFEEAGFESGVFTTLLISSGQVEGILSHRAVKAATLTGSGPAGSAVASTAGAHVKQTVLELGGSDAYLILADADIALAAEHCVTSRLLNAGQSCIGAKRFIAVPEIYETFLEEVVDRMRAAQMGDPFQAVDMGPMARHDLRDEVHQQVIDSVAAGAHLLLGGHIPEDSQGAYYPPTILTEVVLGMPAYNDELFGPVASIIRATDEADAIRIANDTHFGLGACVFTKDVKRGEEIARNQLEAGSCFVNQYVKSDPRLPFGGINDSGYGRELGYYGIRAFTNVKTLYIG